MKALIGMIVIALMIGSIPFFMGEDEVRGERGDPLMVAPPTRGNTIIVDINGTGDYTSIQEAINLAKNGDIVHINNGNYYEDISINKQLTIQGNGTKTILFFDNDINCTLKTSNTIIQNLSVYNNNPNICLNIDNSINIVIDKLLFFVDIGIQITNSDFIKINNSTFNNTKLAISILDGSSNILIENNRFYDCERNIKTSSDCIILKNMFTNSKYGLFFDKSNVNIINNYFINCSCSGHGNTLVFDNNNFINTTNPHEIEGDIIYINNSKYLNSGPDTVIEILGCNYCSVNNIIVDKGGCGFKSSWSIKELYINKSIFSNITNITNSGILIDSHELTSASIINCIISNNNRGISLSSDYNDINIKDNKIINNNIGIQLAGSSSLIQNNIISNNQIGIIFGGTNHKVYNNDFITNIEQFRPGGNGNILFSSYSTGGGNYWSDYQGKDKKRGTNQDQWGSDGYGDIPYQIGSMSDKYPIIIDKIKPSLSFLNFSLNESESIEFPNPICSDDNLVIYSNWTFVTDYGEYKNVTRDMVDPLPLRLSWDRPCKVDVFISVSDYAGNNNSTKGSIIVNDILSPMAISNGDLSCLEGENLTFNASNSYDTGKISKYEWNFFYKNDHIILEGIQVTYFFEKPGIIPVNLKVTDSVGHIGNDMFIVTVIDITDPIAEAGNNIIIDNGYYASFNGSLSTDNGLLMEYNWTFEYGEQTILLQGIESSYKFDKPGIYNITLTVTDQFGNKAIDWLTLTVRDTIKPIPVITGLTTFLENENIKLSGKTSTDNGVINKYVWTIEDNGNVTVENVDLDYKVKIRGYHKVFLTVFDEWGNNATTNLTINAIDSNKPFTAAGPDQDVAVGTTVTLDASGSHDDGTITKYQWTFSYDNQNQELLGRIVTFKFDKPGTYEVTLKVYDDSENYGIDAVMITVKNTGVVKGIVKDDKGKPIDEALVEIIASDGKTYTFTTAPDGSFSLAIPPGSFTWKISKDGYGTITGSSTVDILGENTLDLAGTPMKKTASTGTSPVLFIIPIVVIILLIVGVVVFILMRKKKTAPEKMEVKVEGEVISQEPAEGGASVETPLPPEASEFVQAPPVMEEDVPVEKVEENTTVADLLTDKEIAS